MRRAFPDPLLAGAKAIELVLKPHSVLVAEPPPAAQPPLNVQTQDLESLRNREIRHG
ncbi:hypothetical protein CHELA20_54413 [Hyphomicrobiales bacterium]|nr:hypothetical protein CHELA41_20515 [Hyphomicrobiales bacterium]CAH1686214.1 hypothetical protein CHELA20_54413 [Hyphomicrobiales bacterium]